MSKTEKLLQKLKNEKISAAELRTLLVKLGWALDRTRGSHEVWVSGSKRITLATHTKDVPRYQIKQVKEQIGE